MAGTPGKKGSGAMTTETEAELREELRKAQDHIQLLQSEGRVLTCVYCGHQYPPGTPKSGVKVLTDHIRQCPQHPLARVIKERDLLRGALVDLVGGSTPDELAFIQDTIETMIRNREQERSSILQAIRALKATAVPANEAP
jgi:hypothetical protein